MLTANPQIFIVYVFKPSVFVRIVFYFVRVNREAFLKFKQKVFILFNNSVNLIEQSVMPNLFVQLLAEFQLKAFPLLTS